MDKILTVSIAAYNVEKYISCCLDSFANLPEETLSKIEVLVVNDGSKDSTIQVAAEYSERFPDSIKIIDKENGGYGSTINASLLVAKGKYYKLLDGDDWFSTENLPKFIQYLDEVKEDIVFTPYKIFHEQTGEVENPVLPYTFQLAEKVNNIKQYSMPTLTIKTDLIKGKFSITEHCFYTDVEYFVNCLENAENYIAVNIPIYCYRVDIPGQSSVNLNNYLRHIDDHELITKKVLKLVYGNNYLEGIKNHINTMAGRHVGYLLYLKPSKENHSRFTSFCDFLKANYPDVYTSIANDKKIAYKYPRLFYFLISVTQRFRKKIR